MAAGYPAVCMCPCHGYTSGTVKAGNIHPGIPCWCYEPQAPVVVVPPKFCPHCGGKL